MVLLISIIAVALLFDYTNGFHDTANAIATSVSTRALSPRVAVLMAASLNLVGALLYTGVAKTVGEGLVDTDLVTLELVLAALIGAVVWNFTTWYFGIPSSSSHALFGGLIGAMIAAVGVSGVDWEGVVDEGHPADGRLSADRLHRRLDPHDRAHLARAQVAAGAGEPLVPHPAAHLGRVHGLLARRQRRPEDHGHHHPGALRQRRDRRRSPSPSG